MDLKELQAQINEANARWETAFAEEERLRAELRESTKPIVAQIEHMQGMIGRMEEHAQPAIAEQSVLKTAAYSDRLLLQRKMHFAHFQVAQSELDAESLIDSATLAENLDEIIKSRREIDPRWKTLGAYIVQELRGQQRYGGLRDFHLDLVYTRSAKGGTIHLTGKQKERCWEYLEHVCIERGDDSLAPPFYMELEESK